MITLNLKRKSNHFCTAESYPHTTLRYIVLGDIIICMKNSENTKGEDIKNSQIQMRRGMLEFCTLLTIAKGKVYASDILESLKEVDLIVVEGTLYPLLNRLKTEGYLSYNWQESHSGPPRKYYTLTAKGRDKLAELKKTWRSLVESITNLI